MRIVKSPPEASFFWGEVYKQVTFRLPLLIRIIVIIKMNTSLKRVVLSVIVIAVALVIFLLSRTTSGIKTDAGEFPQSRLSNGIIDATLYLPDTSNGYYRGARFDWSGVMPVLEYDGHNYFGQWFTKYDPYIHDAIMGPVNDFYPLGYDEGQPGDTFIKIGIGAFIKQDEKPYSFSRQAELIDPGKWKVSRKKDRVIFTHSLDNSGYSYEYIKTVRLEKSKPVLVLSHTIINHGQKTIETDVYNHNFFVIDNQPTGPDFTVEFPFTLIGQFRRNSEKVEFFENRVQFLQQLVQGESVHGGNVEGFSDRPDDYDIRIENRKTGAGVRITGDKPLSRLVFWASYAVLSPEPYTKVLVRPSEKFSWNITYEFYTL